jgi:hypothetical protein
MSEKSLMGTNLYPQKSKIYAGTAKIGRMFLKLLKNQ